MLQKQPVHSKHTMNCMLLLFFGVWGVKILSGNAGEKKTFSDKQKLKGTATRSSKIHTSGTLSQMKSLRYK